MAMPDERTRTAFATREFLQSLTKPNHTPGVPERVREHAVTLLQHYPDALERVIAGRTFRTKLSCRTTTVQSQCNKLFF